MESRKILDELEEYRPKIEAKIREFYAKEAGERDYTSSFYRRLHKEMEDFAVNGGKRLRGLLLIASYLAYSDRNPTEEEMDSVIKAAAALEIFHAMLLIHDDIVDDDDYRRGKLSMHKRIETILPNGKTTGKDVGIMVGDIMLFQSMKLLSNAGLEADKIRKAMVALTDAAINTAIGESYDLLDNNRTLQDSTFENILFVMTYKTARYTIKLPLQIGAILAGKNIEEDKFDEIANYLGVAFQLQDDLLGLFGDEAKLGKSVKSDVYEGKKTLLMKWLYDESSSENRKFIDSVLGSRISDDDFEKLRDLVIAAGIKKRVDDYILELLKESRQEIAELGMNDKGQNLLRSMIDALAGRDK